MGEMDMIERAARGMYDRFMEAVRPNFGPHWKPEPFASIDDRTRSFYLASAKGAIEAMRAPTEAMLQDAYLLSSDSSPEEHWRAMIDAALSPSPDPRPRGERS